MPTKQTTFKLSRLALAVALALPAIASAQANVADEIKLLKDRITQLEQMLKTQPAPAAAGSVDPAEFNRIRVKTEALEDNFEAQGFKGLKINGVMDPTFLWNKNARATSFNFLNNFTNSSASANDGFTYYNSYFGMAAIDLQKEMDGGNKFRLTLAPHKAASSANSNSIVHEASASIPMGDLQTRFIAGLIPDWSGYEYIMPNQTKLITHNMLFDYTMPNYYVGAGMEVASGKWLSKFLVGNLNSNRYDRDTRSPVLTYRVDYSKGEFEGFGFAGQHGKIEGERFQALEVDGYFVRGPVSLFGQISYGSLANGAQFGDAKWSGFSTTAAYKLTPRFELVGRYDYIKNRKNGGGLLGAGANDDVNGFGTDPTAANSSRGLNRSALSLGLNYNVNQFMTLKAEYRIDRSHGGGGFVNYDGVRKNKNDLFGLSTVISF